MRGLASFSPRSAKAALRPVVDEALYRFGERRQRNLAVAGDVEIDILPAAEILIIGFQDTDRARRA